MHSVLDVCCGTGLMTAALRDRGLHVVGVDASEEMLQRARDLLGPDPVLVAGALPNLPVEGLFDAAVSTLDGLNYLPLEDFRASLAAIATRVRPGGWLVFDLHGDASLPFLADHPVITGETHWGSFTLTNSVDLAARSCTTTIDLVAPDPADSFTETHVQFVHGADDVRDALADAGFADVRALVEYTPAPAGPDTLRITWAARRSPTLASMSHPFRAAVENRDLNKLSTLLAPDVVFRSPVAFRPFTGRATVTEVLGHVMDVFEGFRYTDELAGDGTHALVFAAAVSGKDLEGLDHLRFDDDGLITEFTVMVRPLSGVIALAEAMGPRVAHLAKE